MLGEAVLERLKVITSATITASRAPSPSTQVASPQVYDSEFKTPLRPLLKKSKSGSSSGANSSGTVTSSSSSSTTPYSSSSSTSSGGVVQSSSSPSSSDVDIVHVEATPSQVVESI